MRKFITIVYAALFIYLVFIEGNRNSLAERKLNLVPFKSIGFLWDRIRTNGSYKYYLNIVGNVLLFIPFPFVLAPRLKRGGWLTVLLAGFLLSLSVELLQYIFKLGVADIDDIILNTTGTAIGYGLLILFKSRSGGQ